MVVQGEAAPPFSECQPLTPSPADQKLQVGAQPPAFPQPYRGSEGHPSLGTTEMIAENAPPTLTDPYGLESLALGHTGPHLLGFISFWGLRRPSTPLGAHRPTPACDKGGGVGGGTDRKGSKSWEAGGPFPRGTQARPPGRGRRASPLQPQPMSELSDLRSSNSAKIRKNPAVTSLGYHLAPGPVTLGGKVKPRRQHFLL